MTSSTQQGSIPVLKSTGGSTDVVERIGTSVNQQDEAVRETNNDCTLCKLSAVTLGYWEDPFVTEFKKFKERRAPEINRGYYARVKAIERMVLSALGKVDGNAQIVNLGAGYDTLYWRLKQKQVKFSLFIELDMPQVIAQKLSKIQRSAKLKEHLGGEVKEHKFHFHGDQYHAVSLDLRQIDLFDELLSHVPIQFNQPAIFLSECVLVYMEPEESSRILRWVTKKFDHACFINYDPVNMTDKFASVMLENLESKGCKLTGVELCASPQVQRDRFLNSNWGRAECWQMDEVYRTLPKEDVTRMEALELFDEPELLTQLLQHYCLTLASHLRMPSPFQEASYQ